MEREDRPRQEARKDVDIAVCGVLCWYSFLGHYQSQWDEWKDESKTAKLSVWIEGRRKGASGAFSICKPCCAAFGYLHLLLVFFILNSRRSDFLSLEPMLFQKGCEKRTDFQISLVEKLSANDLHPKRAERRKNVDDTRWCGILASNLLTYPIPPPITLLLLKELCQHSCVRDAFSLY